MPPNNGARMKYLMMIFTLAAFGFAGWTSQHLVSDIQFLLMMLGVFSGMILIGLAAVLIELEREG